MTTPQPPNQQPDPANIGPADLWAVWVSAPQFLRDAGAPPVSIEWMLAAPGEEGFRRLETGFNKDFTTAMPLDLMRQIAAVLPQEPAGGMPKWVRVALGTEATLILARDASGNARVVSKPSELRDGEQELVRGSRRDFNEILHEGERILREKDWKKIFGDDRPFVKKGEVGWLHYARNPEGAAAMEEILNRVRCGE